jgi:hypothetical protein
MTPRHTKGTSAKSIADAVPIHEDTPVPVDSNTEIKDAQLSDGSVIIEVVHRDNNEFMESLIAAPKQYSSIGALGYRGGAYWNRRDFDANKDSILEAMINEGMIGTPIEKRTKKSFEKKFKVVTPDNSDSKLHRQVMMFFDKHSLWLKLWQATMNSESFGSGYLWYQYADIKSWKDLIKPVKVGPVKLDTIEHITKYSWKGTERLPNNEPKYYVFGSKDGNEPIELKIHPSRIIPITNDPLGTHPDGVASLLKTFNHVDDLRSIIWMMRQLLLRRGAPITIIYIPNGYPDTAKATMRKSFKQAQPNDIITIPFDPNLPKDQQIRVEWNPSFSSIGNLQPIIDISIDSFCASIDYPRQLWQGSGAGSISGSETNIIQWLSGISADQNMKHTPVVRTIIEWGQKHGQIEAQDDFFIEWTPLEEVSLVDLNRMQLNASVIAVNLNNNGWDVILTDNGMIDYNATKKTGIVTPSAPTELPNSRAGDIRNPDTEAPGKLKPNTIESNNFIEIQDLKSEIDKLYKALERLSSSNSIQASKASTPEDANT